MTEVLRTPSSNPTGFKLMTSRSWQYISCHWDACSNYTDIYQHWVASTPCVMVSKPAPFFVTCNIHYFKRLLKCMWMSINFPYAPGNILLTLKLTGVIGWISDSYCSIKPFCSGMVEVVPARTSPTLLPPSPCTVLWLPCFKVSQCINCCD